MGRTHSNAYKRVNDFFDVEYRPVLKAVCGRTADGRQGVRRAMGLRVGRDRLAEAGRPQGHRRDRHLHAQQHARRDRDRRGRGRQDDPLREAAVDEPGRGPEDGRRRSRRPACPTRSGTTTAACPAVTLAKQLIDDGTAGQDLPLPRQLPPGLDDLGRPAPGRHGALAARRGRRRLGRHRRPAGPLHRHGPLAQRLDRLGLRHDRDVHQGAEAQPHGQGRAGRASTTPARSSAGSRTARSGCSSRPATPAATRRSTRSRSTARRRRSSGTCDDLHRLEYFDHRDDSIIRGWRSIHVTDGDHPYMKNWWVPGPPDRLRAHVRAPGRRLPREPRQGPADGPDLPRRPGHAGRLRRRARLGRAQQVGDRRAGVSERLFDPQTADIRENDHAQDRNEPAAVDHPRHRAARRDPRPDQGDRLRRRRGPDLRHGRPRAVRAAGQADQGASGWARRP